MIVKLESKDEIVVFEYWIVSNLEFGVVLKDKFVVFEVNFDDELCLKCVKDELVLL